jgi:transcription elongation factor GreA
MKKFPLTQRGADLLREELKRLKFTERPKLSRAIATAREHGDLRENAEYHAAKEQQSFVEGRIKEVETKLSNAEIIDISRLETGGRIVFGATVNLADVDSGVEVSYQIVGEDEADIKSGLISITSPIARAIIGKRAGDEVAVEAPSGRKCYEITQVRYV